MAAPGPAAAIPLPRRIPQVPPPPFGVAVSPGGESLFTPPKRRPRVDRLREPDPVLPPGELPPGRPYPAGMDVPPDPVRPGGSDPGAAPRWAPHPPVARPAWGEPPAAAQPPAPAAWDPAPPAARPGAAPARPDQDRAGTPDAPAAWAALPPAAPPARPAATPDAPAPWAGAPGTPSDPQAGPWGPTGAGHDLPPVPAAPGDQDTPAGDGQAVSPVGEDGPAVADGQDRPAAPGTEGPGRRDGLAASAGRRESAAGPEHADAPVDSETVVMKRGRIRGGATAAGERTGRPSPDGAALPAPAAWGDPAAAERREAASADRGWSLPAEASAGASASAVAPERPPTADPASPAEEPAGDPGWGLPPTPARAADPAPGEVPVPRATGLWTRSPAARPEPGTPDPHAPFRRPTPGPVAPAADARTPYQDGPAAPAGDRAQEDRGTAAEQWIAERLATERAGQRPPDEPGRAAAAADDARPAPGEGDARRPVGSGYVEDPTEVIGPFDIGSWTLQAPDGERTRGRRAGRREDRVVATRRPDAAPPDQRPADPGPYDARPEHDDPRRLAPGTVGADPYGARRPDPSGSGPHDLQGSGPRDLHGSGPDDLRGSGPHDLRAPDSWRDSRAPDAGARLRTAGSEVEDRELVGVGGGGSRPPTSGGGRGRGGGGRGGDGDPPDDDRPRTTGDRVRTLVSGIGQTLLTIGVILLLLVVYEVWFTDVVNDRTQSRLRDQLEQEWETGDDPVVAARTPARPGAKVRSIPLGDGFALIYVPDFGTDYVYTVVEGTGTDQLDAGPGHYVDTPLPGQVGNVAIAGHRVGKGSPFLNLDKLRAGSAIVIRTKTYWYTYRVLGDTRTGDPTKPTSFGVRGQQIVDPSDVGVLQPVPNQPGVAPTRRLLTLTTCHPKFSARQRMVIHAVQDGAPYPTSRGVPPSMTS